MSSIVSGTIFKIKIPFNLGYAYCKVIDFSALSIYNGVLVKVYDFFSEESIKSVDFFKELPLLLNEIPMFRMPTLKGKHKWERIGVLKEEKDAFIPAYKICQREGFAFDTIESYESEKWYALINYKEELGPLPFKGVRHLEELYLRSTVTIERRIAMAFLRTKSIDVEVFFQKQTIDNNWLTEFNCQRVIPQYKDIPEPIRGRPLVKGYVPDEYLNFEW
ncbi:MAG: Imm26 family immunity protein [Chitinophagaceae bacterium]